MNLRGDTMKIFIHTFSISVNITREEYRKVISYKWMPLKKSYTGEEYISSVTKFCDSGLRIQIKKRNEQEICYDKGHRPLRMDLIVTPYKLLHPGKCLGAITDLDELRKALKELSTLVDKIEKETGIVIDRNYKIQRVDITCDVVTPSDVYSREIIAASKTADLPYGYLKCEATDEQVEEYGWEREDCSLYYNKNQSLFAKIYDKKKNIQGTDEYADLQKKGLIRYELELTRKFLKQKGLLEQDDLTKCLMSVMNSAEELFKKYFVDNLYKMPAFSLKVLDQYLDMKFAGKVKTIEKLKGFCRAAYRCKKQRMTFDATQCGMSDKAFDNCCKKLEDINISPIPAEADCPYIPSIEDLLEGVVENKLLWFADRHTRGKELWFI